MKSLDFLLGVSEDIKQMLFGKHKISKPRLLLEYVKILIKYLFAYKLLRLNLKEEKLFGYKIGFYSYGTFLGLFKEIFVSETYAFDSDTDSPEIIDCGSNIGMSILYFKMMYPNSKIIAFEPEKNTFDMLERNIKMNRFGSVEVINAAVYDKDGSISFFEDSNETGSLGMSVTKRLEEYGRSIKEKQVPSVRLSRYLKLKVDLLKIDVEGAENAIIQECSSNLGIVKRIIMEYHYNKSNIDNDLIPILQSIKKSGFSYVLTGNTEHPLKFKEGMPYKLILYAYR